ncbi:hypothetical protein [Micromonospora sp. NPDC092111]|uniref:hypothetical protein n=1 Tax=Micromonospora sp. NPDC092111 TaxID=3364289 RepID=UPI0038110744
MALGRSAVEEPRLAIQWQPSRAFLGGRFLWSIVPVSVVAAIGSLILLLSGNAWAPLRPIAVVEGRLASKSEYFLDAEVERLLLKHHVRVHISRGGSRDIATNSLDPYDFVFPSGQPAADLILARLKDQGRSTTTYKPFTSPIVLASYREYAESLQAAGIAVPVTGDAGPELYYRLDLKRFLQLVQDGRRWNSFGRLASANRVTAWTPDICRANSAATYMALVAFVRNGEEIPKDQRAAEKLAAAIEPLLGVIGLPPADLIEPYTSPEGRSRPIVVIYEHQYLSYQLRFKTHTGSVDADRILLYPSVNFLTEPQFIPLTPAGERVGQLLTKDPDLRRRAIELGFRPVGESFAADGGPLQHHLDAQGLPRPPEAVHTGTTAHWPPFDTLERMITMTGNCPSR